MKLKIEHSFVDKYNGKRYNVGDEIEFEAGRAKELLNDDRGLVSATVPADEIFAVDEDGSETPLTELKPDLSGEAVTIDGGSTVKPPKRTRSSKKK